MDRSGPDQSQNRTGVRGVIENNRTYTAQIDVQQVTETDYHIVVLLDGAKIIDWQGAQNRLVPSGGTEYAATSRRKIAAGATKCTLEVRGLEMLVPPANVKSANGKTLPSK
ncbi:hypothetical protein [Anatilimnocola floriformis]|uniref:hypothetical protein n=1 Tax=Anatilimnocola floriformis TaxID=2948575 RepID=UPI0020C2D27A|nr:hypothetical protein [Anatilimnocola floriformis]